VRIGEECSSPRIQIYGLGMSSTPATGLQLQSLVTAEALLQLSLADVAVAPAGDGEVVIRVEAAPINPSDLALLLAWGDVSQATASGTTDRPVVSAPIGTRAMAGLAGRVGQRSPVGNEGAGTVISAGADPAAQALLGKVVAVAGGAMYTQYRTVPAMMCLELPDGTSAVDGASCFVNPLTALSMVETMKREGHTALVHTAAASNLGQMLNRVCLADGVQLVNIVRKPEQEDLLRSQGATHVCDSSSPTFKADLTAALVTTGATIAFDATGGGTLASDILSCMENAANASAKEYSRYGSSVFKQVYIYGGLDRSPTTLTRNFGLSWSVSGWLLTPFLGKVGLEVVGAMRARVAAEVKTTFASHYTKQVSLAGALDLETLRAYAKQATGEKYLITPYS
jgi:NADPH:quinone reductase